MENLLFLGVPILKHIRVDTLINEAILLFSLFFTLYITVKYHEHIPKGFQVTEQT